MAGIVRIVTGFIDKKDIISFSEGHSYLGPIQSYRTEEKLLDYIFSHSDAFIIEIWSHK